MVSFEIIYPSQRTTESNIAFSRKCKCHFSKNAVDIRLAALIECVNVDYFATYNINDFRNISGLPIH